MIDWTLPLTSAYQRWLDLVLNTSGLVGVWPGGEFTGTRCRDLSKYRQDGTYTGGYTLGKASPVPEVSACQLNGSTGYLTIADAAHLDISDAATFEILMRHAGTPAASFAAIDKGVNSMQLGWDNTNSRWRMNVNNVGANVITVQGVTQTDTRWHSHIVTKNGTARAWWYDYIQRGVDGTNRTAVSGATALNVGRNAGGSEYSPILWALFAHYNRPLTVAEVGARAEIMRPLLTR